MKDDELNPRNGEGNEGGEDNGTGSDGRRPNGGSGTAGPKLPGNDGGKDQYSLGHGEETSNVPPVEGEDESEGE